MQSLSGAAELRPEEQRKDFIDVFRGLLIAHMALDHASLMFNAGRGAEELAAAAPPPPGDLAQFLTRFTGVPVAPAFFFVAGLMVALTSDARERRGVPAPVVTRKLLLRGLVLIGADAVIMGLPRAAQGFYSFMVLSSIGVAIMLLAGVRHLPAKALLALALGMLVLHPLLDVSALPVALRAVMSEPVREGAFRSMYPVLPWCGLVFLGFVVGRDSRKHAHAARTWLGWGTACLAVFSAVRWLGGYGNAYPHSGIAGYAFWTFAKYPPDLPFLSWGLATTFFGLTLVLELTRRGVPWLLQPFALFGRVPFFFYLLHFYVLGIWRAVIGRQFLLPGTFAVWLALLVVMAWPCAWYYRKKRERPNFVTRYL